MTEKMRRRIALALSAVLACLPALVQAQTAELQKGLSQLFATAEQHNATLRSLETALQTAEAGVITAQAAKLPDITGEAAVSYLGNARLWNRQFGESTAAPMPHFGNNFSLAARQVVYGGGGINAGIQLARQGGKLAQLNAEDGKQRVRFLLTGLYLQLHNLRNGQEVYAANAALARQLIEQMHKRREHVLEMVYYEEVMHYADHIYERLNQWSLPGIWAGCLFSLGGLRLMRWNAYKLIAVGLAVFSLYAAGFYFLVLCPADAALGHTRRAPPREAYANLAACGLAGSQRRASPTKIAPLATQTEQNGIRVCFVIFSTWPKAKAGRSRGGGRR